MTREKFQELVGKIKQHKNEWRIEKVLTFNGKCGNEPYQEWDEMLLHNSAELKYKDDKITIATGKFLRVFPSKMFYKHDFELENWEEIKQLLGYREKNEEEKIEEILQGFRTHKYDNLTSPELIKEIEKEKLNNASLQKLLSISETRIRELEEEVRKLKAEIPQTQKTRQGIAKREKQLNQWKQSRKVFNSSIANNNNNNNPKPFPYLPVIGIISLVVLFTGLITYQVRKNKRR